jgi:hypothetical protein
MRGFVNILFIKYYYPEQTKWEGADRICGTDGRDEGRDQSCGIGVGVYGMIILKWILGT